VVTKADGAALAPFFDGIHSHRAKNVKTIPLRSANADGATDTIKLISRRPFKITHPV
jgi:hypothetical protein